MIKLYKGDCLEESDKIESGSVDLILTDLPYGTVKGAQLDGWNGTKTDWDEVIDTSKIMAIAGRILRKNGKMVLFAQEPFTTELINGAVPNVPFNYRMIWEKDHFANALVAKKACVSYYEDVLVFSKKHDYEALHPLRPYFVDIKAFIGKTKKDVIAEIGQRVDHCLRVDSSQFGLCTENTYEALIDTYGIDKMDGFREYNDLKQDVLDSTFNLWQGSKHKSNILKYSKDYTGHHPTQKPVLLLEDIIKTFSNKGDLVVDLTMGSGSTGVACVNTDRDFTGIELGKEYFNIAKKRIFKL